jgi:hypothetical protein
MPSATIGITISSTSILGLASGMRAFFSQAVIRSPLSFWIRPYQSFTCRSSALRRNGDNG